MKENPPKAVLVLGMHRSGTSALTRVINLAGASMPSNLLAARPKDNDKGFWESEDILDIHSELMAEFHFEWDYPGDFRPLWEHPEIVSKYESRLLEVLERDFSDSSLFVIKDPRICRLVPLWLTTLKRFGADPLFVLPIRNPLDVAASLETRNRVPQSKSFIMWIRHVLESEFYTRGYQRCFSKYEDLLDDWRKVLSEISENCGIDWPGSSPESIGEIEDFLTVDLRHHHSTYQELMAAPNVPSHIKTVYDWVFNGNVNSNGSFDQLDQIKHSLEMADDFHAPMILDLETQRYQLAEQVEEGHSKIRELWNQTQALRAQQAERDRKDHNLSMDLEKARDEIAGLMNDIHNTVREKDRMADLINQTNEENEKLQGELTELAAKVRSIKVAVAKEIGKMVRSFHYNDQNGIIRFVRKRHHLKRLKKSGIVDADWYLLNNQDVAGQNIDPYFHYLQYGSEEGREPNPFLSDIFAELLNEKDKAN